jgi:hypothetical protein
LKFEEYIAQAQLTDEALAGEVATLERTSGATVQRWTLRPVELLTALWLGGVVLFTLPIAVGLVQVRRLRRTGLAWPDGQRRIEMLLRELGLRRPVDVLVHEAVAAPATCGFVRQAIATASSV